MREKKLFFTICFTSAVLILNIFFNVAAHTNTGLAFYKIYGYEDYIISHESLITLISTPYWSHILLIFVYIQQIVWLLFFVASITKLHARIGLPIYIMLIFTATLIIDILWVVFYVKSKPLHFFIFSVAKLISSLVWFGLSIRYIQNLDFFSVTPFTLNMLRILYVNGMTSYVAWTFYRMLQDISIGVSFAVENLMITTCVPITIYFVCYIIFFVIDISCYQKSFAYNLSNYVVFMVLLSGSIYRCHQLVPTEEPETVSSHILVLAVALVSTFITFIQKLVSVVYTVMNRKNVLNYNNVTKGIEV